MSRAELLQQGSLLDHLDGVAFWIASEPRTFEYVSSGFEDIWGIDPERVEDDLSLFIEGVHPEDREEVRALVERGEGEIDSEALEHRVVQPDGTVRWVQATLVPLRDDAGDAIEMVGVTVDITEQKRRELEFEALNRILRHDIRNDMAIVLGWVELLEEHVDEGGEDVLRKILTAGEHVVELTETARDYAEALAGGEEMQLTPVSLESTLVNEIELRREAFPDAQFRVDELDADAEVLANSMLSSVFRNLLNNAVQHNDSPEPVIEVSTERSEDADTVVVRIADNGPGIPDEHKETVFGKSRKGLDSSGAGIGLYLVATLIEQYGGRVWIEDNDPTGAVFNVELQTA